MHNSECIGRLVNSATHDVRNVLAVIRESVGLAQDILARTDPAMPRLQRLLQALQTVQEQVGHGAALAEGMGYLGQCAEYAQDNSEPGCDLCRIAQDFCTMAARRGKACALLLSCRPAAEPVLSPVAPLEVFRALLSVFDACVAVGGGVSLCFRPVIRHRAACMECEVLDGGKNRDMVIAALTGHPLLHLPNPSSAALWAEKILPGVSSAGQRFVLPMESPKIHS